MKMKKITLILSFAILQIISFSVMSESGQQFNARTGDIIWSDQVGEEGETIVHLYVYWSLTCPHCERALPYVKNLSKRYPWVKLHLREVSKNQKHLVSLHQMAEILDEPSFGEVPAFFFCGLMYTGYGEDDTTGQWIEDTLVECRDNSI